MKKISSGMAVLIFAFLVCVVSCANDSKPSSPGGGPTQVNQFHISLTNTPTQNITATATDTPTIYPTYTPTVMKGWTLTGFWHAELDTVCPDFGTRVYTSKSNITFRYALLETDTYDNGDRNSGSLTSPVIAVKSGQSLKFSSWSDTECSTGDDPGDCGYDYKIVYVSINGGTDWDRLVTLSDDPSWKEVEIPLAAYAGENAIFRFFFDTNDAEANDNPGWYIDDVRVETTTP